MRTSDRVPKRISRKLPKLITVQGLLAADLALNQTTKFKEWDAVTPTREDIWASLPLTWHPDLQALLPGSGKDLLKKQSAKLKRDWDMVQPAFPTASYDDYLYAWLLVNTRTFYYTNKKTEKLPPHECMVLQPVADLFNHADEGCGVQFDATSFEFLSKRSYEEGEEVYISYGSHSNDLLLVEYGFILETNRWDEACIDDVVLPELSSRQKEQLEERGFLGKYMVDAENVCHRTQVALRILCVSREKWEAFADGMDDGEKEQEKVDRLLLSMLKKYEKVATKRVVEVGAIGVGEECHRDLLSRRWKQIQSLMANAIEKLES